MLVRLQEPSTSSAIQETDGMTLCDASTQGKYTFMEDHINAVKSMEYWEKWEKLLLGEMKDKGLCIGDYLDKSLVQFCFRNIIQDELDEIKRVWNSHRIRPTNNPNCYDP
ncbi:unnamed protein product [Arctogadus glacialis]